MIRTSKQFLSVPPIKLFVLVNSIWSKYKEIKSFFFSAVNDACLVYDGRLVIDASFHTNDVAIRAAGPLTKFQRSYHADQWTHANFNSKEIGVAVSFALIN